MCRVTKQVVTRLGHSRGIHSASQGSSLWGMEASKVHSECQPSWTISRETPEVPMSVKARRGPPGLQCLSQNLEPHLTEKSLCPWGTHSLLASGWQDEEGARRVLPAEETWEEGEL